MVRGVSFCSPIFEFAFTNFSFQECSRVQTALPWVHCTNECLFSAKKIILCFHV